MRQKRQAEASRPGTLARVLDITAGIVGLLVLASVALLAIVHVDDRWGVIPRQGVLMALAQAVSHGILYPPLHAGGEFGGTRYMPAEFVLHAGGALITGEYVLSGKLLAYAVGIAFVALVCVLLRSAGVERGFTYLLVGAVLVSPLGYTAATQINADLLPVLLQLAAVALLLRSVDSRHVAAAAVLCAGALFVKSTEVWALVAIVIWLGVRSRTRLPIFVACFGGSVLVLVAATEAASDGRFLENILELSASEFRGFQYLALNAPVDVARAMLHPSWTFWVLGPLALLETILATRSHALTLIHVSFLAAVPIALVVLSEVGTTNNHLIDLTVLAALCTGLLWVRLSSTRFSSLVTLAVVLSVVTAYPMVLLLEVKGAARNAVEGTPTALRSPPLADWIHQSDSVLSEDPSVMVERGRSPIVLDPFMLRRILSNHPAWRRELVDRIDRREFDKVVLRSDYALSDPWYRNSDFGRDVAFAIDRNYRLWRRFPNNAEHEGRFLHRLAGTTPYAPEYRVLIPRSP